MSSSEPGDEGDLEEIVDLLRGEGAVFAYLHGSVATGNDRADSDVDVAAHFDGADPPSWEIPVPAGIDLVVLDSAPLALAGRIALHGRLLFDDDPPKRVAWEATTRKIYLDERHRSERATDDLVAGVRRAVTEHGDG